MKSLKKTLVLLVVLSMILSAVSPVFAFNDVIAEEYAEQANKMGAFGVFAGDNEGNFKAEENITRAEMAVIIGKLMGLTANEANANQYYASNFSDVAAGDWYTGWVNLVAGRGIISGFPDGTFRPNEKVTQAQAVTMIVKALGWGVVVDQTGTWPANYITKASELRLFKDAVESNGELVTRGNVAIYCYNALTAKTWDVTSSEDGKLTSSSANTTTILEKYFSDFTNEAGDMKLVEGAKVTASGALTSAIGVNQVELNATAETVEFEGNNELTLAEFLGLKANVKNKEEKTYTTANEDVIVAYVPAEVANIASLKNKTVDVIFGKDNKVAYIAVTDDSYSDAYVTAWDYSEEIIEIDGEEYEFDAEKAVTLNVFGTTVYTGNSVKDQLNTLFTETLEIAKPKTNFNRTVAADLVLDEDGEISTIDLKFSSAYTVANKLSIEERVVEKITSADAVKDLSGNTIFADLEDLEDTDDPRVIKNNELVSLADIAEGNVLTIVRDLNADKVVTIIISDETVNGTVTSIKNSVIKIDDTAYNKVINLAGDLAGEFDDAKTGVDLTNYDDETVNAYLNFLGEVSVIVADTNIESMTLGVIAEAVVENDDLIEDKEKEVNYLRLKIYNADASKAKSYYVYNEDADENVDDASEYDTFLSSLAIGDVVVYSADDERVILSDEIIKVDSTSTPYTIDQTKLTLVKFSAVDVDDESADKANYDRKLATILGTEYRFSSLVAAYNFADDKVETIKGWDSLCNKSDDFVTLASESMILVDGTRVKYLIADIDTYATQDETKYALLTDIDVNDDDKDIATLFVDGEYKDFELDGLVADRTKGTLSYTTTEVATEITNAKADLEEAKAVETSAKAIVKLAALEADATTTDVEAYTAKFNAINTFNTDNGLSVDLSGVTADDITDAMLMATANEKITALNAKIDAIVAKATANVTTAKNAVTTAEGKVVVAEVGYFITYELTDGDISSIDVALNVVDFPTNDETNLLSLLQASKADFNANTLETVTRDHLAVYSDEDSAELEIAYAEIDDKHIGSLYVNEDYIVYDFRDLDDVTMYTGSLEDLDGEIVLGFIEEEGEDASILVILK